jgi:hypothetical protein
VDPVVDFDSVGLVSTVERLDKIPVVGIEETSGECDAERLL